MKRIVWILTSKQGISVFATEKLARDASTFLFNQFGVPSTVHAEPVHT